ncbi:signal peptidase I [Brevundimonas sp. 2R-24]|uniref:Signal peptidase I n=1 Tax=Peiella sedimenti TaxID=3061083 RepID=A0ABT8SN30_9CAUL|nr:signal peptidase I [Caulobacteraceae bacterium XZ-24]
MSDDDKPHEPPHEGPSHDDGHEAPPQAVAHESEDAMLEQEGAGPAADEVEAAEANEQESAPAPAKSDDLVQELKEIGKTVFYALLIAMVLRTLFFQPFTIPSASMEPNLYEGDYIIVSKWSYGYSRHATPISIPGLHGRLFGGQPDRGDVVVFKLPSDNRTDYIKRVIGLPGDRIQMRDGRLYINDQPVEDTVVSRREVESIFGYSQETLQVRETLPEGRSFMTQDYGAGGDLDDTGVYVVPEGHYFMMGDNRDNSLDSRVDLRSGGVDMVPAENLIGEAQIILFSWHPGASLFKPWTWLTKVRLSRFFHELK